MRVQVIANCQARPISNLIPRITVDSDVLEPIILHLAKPEEREAHLAQVATADIIFAQLTQDSFRCAHLASSALKEQFGKKVIIWPNIFYMGQQPYLRYFTHSTLGRMMGPMEAMHDLRLYKSWKVTGHVDPAAVTQSDPDFIAAARQTSLSDLQAKEANCDVSISDFLTAHEDKEQLFYTFNHPKQLVLKEMALRMFATLGITTTPLEERIHPEPLSRYQVPSVWAQNGVEYQGDQFTVDPGKGAQRLPGKPQKYTIEALCEAYQQTYDAHEAYQALDGIRLTPSTGLDRQILTD